VADLPIGAMRRVTNGDLDVLLAHTVDGIVATEDRCPHMSAPLSVGELDGCIVACPLHEGRALAIVATELCVQGLVPPKDHLAALVDA